MPKLSVNFGNHISQNSQRTNIPVLSVISVSLHHNTVINVRQIYRWSAMSFSLVTHTDHLHDHPIHALVGLFGTSYHVLVWSIIKWHHHSISVLDDWKHLHTYSLLSVAWHCNKCQNFLALSDTDTEMYAWADICILDQEKRLGTDLVTLSIKHSAIVVEPFLIQSDLAIDGTIMTRCYGEQPRTRIGHWHGCASAQYLQPDIL